MVNQHHRRPCRLTQNGFGRLSSYVATVGYSFALFVHFIPATVETLTRLPAGAPYLAHPEDPKAQPG
jgi:hypothetical protein